MGNTGERKCAYRLFIYPKLCSSYIGDCIVVEYPIIGDSVGAHRCKHMVFFVLSRWKDHPLYNLKKVIMLIKSKNAIILLAVPFYRENLLLIRRPTLNKKKEDN